MYCLRCGKDTTGKEVFCSSCLEAMEKYPIKPGTSVQLPKKKAVIPTKKTSRRVRATTAEELVVHMRKAIRILAVLLALCLLLLSAAVGLLIHYWQTAPEAPIGQNYTVVSTEKG